MKKTLILYSILIGLTFAQNNQFKFPSLELNFSIGRESFHLVKPSSIFNEAKSIYRSQGINMPDQTNYPDNYFFGGNIAFMIISKSTFIGFSYKNSSTAAFSLYEDRLGNIDLRSEINYSEYLTFLKYYFSNFQLARPYILISGGIGSIDYSFQDKGSIDFMDTYYNTELKGSGSAFLGSISVGISHQVWIFYLFESFTYRMNKIDKLDSEIIVDSKSTNKGEIQFEADMSQLLWEIGFGIKF